MSSSQTTLSPTRPPIVAEALVRHFGSGDDLSTENGVRVAPPGSPSGYPTVNNRFTEKSCKNCHANLHGSNSPSGAFFLR